jgi:hypothetical protein
LQVRFGDVAPIRIGESINVAIQPFAGDWFFGQRPSRSPSPGRRPGEMRKRKF